MPLLVAPHPFAGLEQNGYRCISIDAPHLFVAGTKTRPQHYVRMDDLAIADLPVQDLIHPDGAWMFYWAISSKLYAPPRSKKRMSPQNIAARWGFRYSSRAFLWIKLLRRLSESPALFFHRDDFHAGLGLTTVKNAEDCLLFRKGAPKRRRGVRELIIDPRREHSRKPDEAFRRMEAFCDGPRVELFSRQNRAGWDCWGLEAGKFDAEAA